MIWIWSCFLPPDSESCWWLNNTCFWQVKPQAIYVPTCSHNPEIFEFWTPTITYKDNKNWGKSVGLIKLQTYHVIDSGRCWIKWIMKRIAITYLKLNTTINSTLSHYVVWWLWSLSSKICFEWFEISWCKYLHQDCFTSIV